jgi:uncharacterized protein YjiS (DUF1127 family)
MRIEKEGIALRLPSQITYYSAGEEAARVAADARFGSSVGLGRMVARVMAGIAEMRRRRAVLSELNSLSDRELADIGVSRSDLGRVFEPGVDSRDYRPR